VSQIWDSLKDPKWWVISLGIVAFAVTNAGVTNFNPLILSGYGFSQQKTVLMASPQAGVSMVMQVTATVIMLYVPRVRCIIWVISVLPGIAGAAMIRSKATALLLFLTPLSALGEDFGLTRLSRPALDIETHRAASLTGVYLMGCYNTSLVTMLSLHASNNSGTTKKSFASITSAIWYCK